MNLQVLIDFGCHFLLLVYKTKNIEIVQCFTRFVMYLVYVIYMVYILNISNQIKTLNCLFKFYINLNFLVCRGPFLIATPIE